MIEVPDSRAAADRLRGTRAHLQEMIDDEKKKIEIASEVAASTMRSLSVKIAEIDKALEAYASQGSPKKGKGTAE